MGDPPGPLWVVAGEETKDLGIGDGVRPADTVGAGDIEKGFAEDVFWWVAVGSGVAVAGERTSEIVLPKAGLVAAEGAEPDGVAEDDEATGLGDAHHLVAHLFPVGDVFCGVGADSAVNRGGGKGEVAAVGADGGVLVGVDRNVGGGTEGLAEVSGT